MSTHPPVVTQTDLPNLLHRGKVRDLYPLGDQLMIVTCDRISAFDVVMEQPVPGKGRILTEITNFWLSSLPACQPHHLDYILRTDSIPPELAQHADQIVDRTMIVHKSHVLPVECVVRGYLTGGGWREYQADQTVSGIKLPPGLQNAQKLDHPIFTPSTKATTGHDQPISYQQACQSAEHFATSLGADPALGCDWMRSARQRALEIYSQAQDHAARRGIIIADTKFEFGIRPHNRGWELLLIDEVLTPDSSRFWPADDYRIGSNPPSFDKQFLRDYLSRIDWDKTPPPPTIPGEIIAQTAQRYHEAYRLLTEKSLPT